ncbi:hypothetical protein L1987_80231 [Smallanthus sonchifolius]|uniref:Uncharacterized protein n=1 Tax=Smallanthus sonchifolius TaxID=185202 RepID=A0ACB8YM14_9ASTR|nr:hypothetical protein L1987_80231 [Smallanthus sonchifolius]
MHRWPSRGLKARKPVKALTLAQDQSSLCSADGIQMVKSGKPVEAGFELETPTRITAFMLWPSRGLKARKPVKALTLAQDQSSLCSADGIQMVKSGKPVEAGFELETPTRITAFMLWPSRGLKARKPVKALTLAQDQSSLCSADGIQMVKSGKPVEAGFELETPTRITAFMLWPSRGLKARKPVKALTLAQDQSSLCSADGIQMVKSGKPVEAGFELETPTRITAFMLLVSLMNCYIMHIGQNLS